jgi:hypothetical protein
MKNPSRAMPLFIFTLLAAIALTIPVPGAAETRTVSWTAVTTYTDGTPIEPTKTVTYDVIWSADPGLSSASLRTIASSISQTSATFDPDVLGMARGQTVYFTGDAVLSTGERSALAPAFPWIVPIVSLPPGTPSPAQNVAVSGPVQTAPARLFRLSWDPVTNYADGTPIAAGAVRYTAYWTTDPALSASSLQPLVSSTSATSVTFDPAAAGMGTDQRVYFTTMVTTTSGGQSPLSAGITWVALNPGPAAPSGGAIIRK